MDYLLIRNKAAEFMLSRGWKRLVAKKVSYEQSLFEHSINELDALIQLLPILCRDNHFSFSDIEQKVLITSVIAHDIGKEKKEWQDFILGKSKIAISHIDPALTKLVVPTLCDALGFNNITEDVLKVIESCVNLHMKSARTTASLVNAMFQGTGRWKTLADVVDVLDNFCSAKGIFAALSSLERSFLAPHLKLSYHQLIIRGVSTTLLHRATIDAFVSKHWKPILYYSDGTIYVSSSADEVVEPGIQEIKTRLVGLLNEITGKDMSQLMVGSPVANILPKPDLFDYKEAKIYLKVAASKINRNSFIRKKEKDREKVVKNYLKLIGQEKKNIDTETLNRYSRRIDEAQPEMVIFKFFKAMTNKDMVGQTGIDIAKKEYETVFGQGSWLDLLNTSTLMPAKDMAKTVDYFWRLPGKAFAHKVNTVEELPGDKRDNLLIDILNDIAQKVYAQIPNAPSRTALTEKMSNAFIQDLVKPNRPLELKEIVQKQLEAYSQSKPIAGKEVKKGLYLCPICNVSFEDAVKASANFLDNPQTHTNRGISHGSFGYVIICKTCYYEKILRQLILGDKPREIIILLPRMNIGYASGSLLVEKVKKFYDMAHNLMLGNSTNPNKQLSFAITQLIAKNAFEKELYGLSHEELLEVLTYDSAEANKKKQRRELEKMITEFIGETVAELNDKWATDFCSWDEAIESVIANKVTDRTVNQLRAEAYNLTPHMGVVCHTPNMILVPMVYSISLGKESETNAALRKVFASILVGLALDMTVAIIGNSDNIPIEGGEGVAYVPAVSGVRSLIGRAWVTLENAEKWFKAIGAASILAIATAYPERSNLYSILSALTLGHILRRIEEKSETGQASYYHITYLEMLEEVLG